MDFRDSPREAAFRAEAQAFLAAHKPARWRHPFEDGVDEHELLAGQKAWQRTLFEHGWAAVLWPEEYGGRGAGPIEAIVWNQELARAGLGESIFVVGTAMAGPTIIAHGSPAQKQRYLPPLLRGDEIWCQLFSEPGAGSDLASLAARAVRDGDHWVVSGQKTWCSGAHYADLGILLARTDPSVPKHKGITYFLIDMKAPGVEIRALRQMSGGSHFNEVFLNEVRIPDACRLGPENAGWAAAMTTLLNERMALGGTGGFFSFRELLEHARAHRDRLDAVTRDQIARLYCWDKTLELLNARVVTKLGRGTIPDAESSVMKLALGRILTAGADLGLRIAGAEALRRHGPWQHQFLTAPSLHIAGGTDEIQKNLVAERVLGLPREGRGDRDVPFEKLRRSGSPGA
ncbi:MAG: acyl-CoA dehydrogenase family protein [Deltaproteobacteria bacterium]|nr:acyl-CoA dehydrogenase family protein [Deltaproteobacteria bacterium]